MARRKVALIELLKIRYPTRDEKELFAQIMRGGVLVEGEQVTKPGLPVPQDAPISIRERSPYVSRGGEKLAGALARWRLPCRGRIWIDAGSSTGGFTDCLLQHGARLVYSVDVGEGQLDWRLRGDPRVRPMEGTNVMSVRGADLVPPPASAVADLSFRSLRRAAAHLLGLTTDGWGIFLVKPQFEYRNPDAGFRGVVRDTGTLRAILLELAEALRQEGVGVEKAVESAVRGRKGNREFLFLLRAGGRPDGLTGSALPAELLLE